MNNQHQSTGANLCTVKSLKSLKALKVKDATVCFAGGGWRAVVRPGGVCRLGSPQGVRAGVDGHGEKESER